MSAEFWADFSQLGASRDQGDRPTCLSFAISETHGSAIRSGELLSPESLHRLSARRARQLPEKALTPLQAVDGLENDGQTIELAWPYHSEKPQDPNCAYHTAKALISKFDTLAVVKSIQSKLPACLILDIDLPFFLCNGVDVLQPDPASKVEGRHAIVICGFRDGPNGKEFYIKNSWGDGWAAKGFGWLSEQYVSARSPILIRI